MSAGVAEKALIEKLVERVFEAEDKKHVEEVNRLIEQNMALTGTPILGFNYMGTRYGWNGMPIAVGPNIEPSLMPDMARVHNFRKIVDLDRKLITQFLFRLVSPCRTSQDYRDALPECVVSLDWMLPTLQRTREAGYTLSSDPRAWREYLKVTSKIETYCAMKFLY